MYISNEVLKHSKGTFVMMITMLLVLTVGLILLFLWSSNSDNQPGTWPYYGLVGFFLGMLVPVIRSVRDYLTVRRMTRVSEVIVDLRSVLEEAMKRQKSVFDFSHASVHVQLSEWYNEYSDEKTYYLVVAKPGFATENWSVTDNWIGCVPSAAPDGMPYERLGGVVNLTNALRGQLAAETGRSR